MTNPLAQDLGGVVRLLEKATPGSWRFYEEPLRPNYPVRVMEIQQSNGRAVIPWPGFDSPDQTKAQKRANAKAIIAAVNFLRTHSAEIAGAFRDAERLDALERLLESTHDGMILLHNGNGAGRGITGLGLQNTGRSLRQAIDDSAMQQGGGGE